ncbi:hypothetical protein AAMO2058_000397900 [Amorphochlora amoebiformis]
MGKKVKKSTKSFQKKHLKKALQNRRKKKNVETARKMRAERKAVRAEVKGKEDAARRAEELKEARESSMLSDVKTPVAPSDVAIEDMDLNTFLTAGLEDGSASEDGNGDAGPTFRAIDNNDNDDEADFQVLGRGISNDVDTEEEDDDEDQISDEEKLEEEILKRALGADKEEDSEDVDEKMDEDEDEDEDEDGDEGVEGDEDIEADIKAHEDMMKTLKESDPEFFKHLQQNDRSLLDFEAGQVEDDVDAMAEAVATGALNGHQKDSSPGDGKGAGDDFITELSFTSMAANVKNKPTLNGVKRIVKVFAAACHFGGFESDSTAPRLSSITIADANAFNAVITNSLIHVQSFFQPLLSAAEEEEKKKTNAREKKSKQKKSPGKKPNGSSDTSTTIAFDRTKMSYAFMSSLPKWKKWGPVARVFVKSHTNFLSKLVDKTMIRYVLAHLSKLRPLYAALPSKMAEKTLKILLKLWATNQNDDVSIDAFVEIRGLVVAVGDAKPEVLEACLKQSYLAYIQTAQFTTPRTLPRVKFLADCIAQLYALDPFTGYRYAFVYIRQLAIHLRNALVSRKSPTEGKKEGGKGDGKDGRGGGGKTKQQKKSSHGKKGKSKGGDDSAAYYAGVYNWRFINGLRAWASLLAREASSSNESTEFQPLIYPFVQISLGVIALHPTVRFWPLRLTVARFVHQVAHRTQVYVPLANPLMSLIESPEMSKKTTPSSSRPPDWKGLLRVGVGVVTTRQFQEESVRRALGLLAEHLNSYAYSAAFPELADPIAARLRRTAKGPSRPPSLRKQASALAAVLRDSAKYLRARRAAAGATPIGLVQSGKSLVSTFDEKPASPLGRYVDTLIRAEQERERSDAQVASNQKDSKKKVKDKKKSKRKRSIEVENADVEEVADSARRLDGREKRRKVKEGEVEVDGEEEDDEEDEDDEDIIEEFDLGDFEEDDESDD